jgi:uncharacterized protein (TIGR02118 family)
MTKVIVFLKKKDGMSSDDFRRHWLEVHGPIAQRLPGLKHYVQNHAAGDDPPCDGIAELWFDSPADMQAAFTSEAAAEAARDADNFLADQQVILVEEIQMPIPTSNI